MNEHNIDDRLRTWFTADVGHAEAPPSLVAAVDRIPGTVALPRWNWRQLLPSTRPIVLIALILLLLIGSLLAVGALLRQPIPAPLGISKGWIAFAVDPADGYGEARDIYFTREGTTARRVIGADGDGLSQGCPRFSPDGSVLAYGESDELAIRSGTFDVHQRYVLNDRAVVVVELGIDGDPLTPATRIPLSGSGLFPCPEWSPTGTHVALQLQLTGDTAPIVWGSDLWVADVASGEARTFPVEVAQHQAMAWSPDGSAIAVAEPGQIRTVPIDGSEPAVFPINGDNVRDLHWTPDGSAIVYVGDAIRIIALDGGGDRLVRVDGYGIGSSVSYSPDGSQLAYGRGDGSGLVVQDLEGSDVVVLAVADAYRGPLWSPDGQRLLFTTANESTGTQRTTLSHAIVSVAAASGFLPVVYSSLDLSLEWMNIDHVSWQPVSEAPIPTRASNGWIAFTANDYNGNGPSGAPYRSGDIYLTEEASPPRPIIGFDGDGLDQGCPAFSPEGSRLAYGEGDSRVDRGGRGSGPMPGRAVVVVELNRDGEPIATPNRIALPERGPLPCPEWSPDGRHVAFLAGGGSEALHDQVPSATEVWIVDLASGATRTFPVERWSPSGEEGFRHQELEWAPDGSSIAVTQPGHLQLIPTDDTEPTVLPIDGGEASSLAWMQSGRQIVHLSSDNAIRVLDLDGGGDRVIRAAQGTFHTEGRGVDGNVVEGNVVTSQDGSRLAFVRRTGEDSKRVVVMDIDGKDEVLLPTPRAVDAPDGTPVEVGADLLWSPDGKRLLNAFLRAYWGDLLSVAVTPGSPPVFYPTPDLSVEFMRIQDISWQPVRQ